MKRRTLLRLLLATAWLIGWNLPVDAAAQSRPSIGTDTLLIGDQTVLTLPSAAGFPSTDALARDGVVVVSEQYDTATGVLRSVITSFDPGDHWLHLPDGDSLLLVVADVEVDTSSAEIRDIAPIARAPYTFWEIFRWVLLVLLCALVAFAIWWYLRHRQRVQQVLGMAEKPDARTPYERATDRMATLREEKLWQAGRVKEYYTELTDIVRAFIEETTPVKASDLTSDQTLEALQSTVSVATLRDLFTLADIVKFAKGAPQPADHERAFAMAQQFMDQLWSVAKPATSDADKEAAAHDA